MPFLTDGGDLLAVPPAPAPAEAPPAMIPVGGVVVRPSLPPIVWDVPAPAPAPPPMPGIEEAPRGLPQPFWGPTGPIVAPHPQLPPAPRPPTIPPAAPAPGTGRVDVSPDHRGLPQAGDAPGDVGPIVKPHGEPSPSPTGGGGGTGGDGAGGGKTKPPKEPQGTRTLASADSESAGPPGDHRADAALSWQRFQMFFGARIPHEVNKMAELRKSLPKVIG